MTREFRLWYNPGMIKKILSGVLLLLPVACSFSADTEPLSLEDKIGQMLLLGFRGTEITEDHEVVRILKDIPLGGVVLFDYDVPAGKFPRNILNPEQTRNLISSLQSFSATPLLVAVDAEGGRVNRLKPGRGFLEIPAAADAGLKEPEELQKIYSGLAEQLAGLGFNLNLAPVVDLNINSENPVISSLGRSFSHEPEKVIECSREFISAHRNHHVLTALKHFPGHGSSYDDTHKGLADVTGTYQNRELIPFKRLIRAGLADTVMTAHIINKNIDPDHPATLSPRFIQDILRDRWGYSGVVISDDLHMDAVLNYYSFREAVVKAVQAGCDLLAVSNNGRFYDEKAAHKARDALRQAVQNGEIPIKTIDRSYQRIIDLKKRAGLLFHLR